MEDRKILRKFSARTGSMKQIVVVALIVLGSLSAPANLNAQNAQYIWSPQIDRPAEGGQSEVWFRKRFSLVKPEKAELQVAAGDTYEIFINGERVCQGESYGNKISVDVSESLIPGINIVAAKVRHIDSAELGLAIRLRVKEEGESRYRSLVTDRTWKSYIRPVDGWVESRFRDLSWLSARELATAKALSLVQKKVEAPGVAAKTTAAKKETAKNPGKESDTPEENLQTKTENQPSVAQAAEQQSSVSQGNARFTIDPEFQIDQILTDEETGSIIAMEYDELGRILLSQENGGLLIADPSLQPGDPNRVRVFCDEVRAVQGILALNGRVYVTGFGPDEQALYLLENAKGGNQLKVAETVLRFSGEPGEHGAHSVQLGNDGMLYIMLGNGTSVINKVADTSPFRHPYEGDLVARYEDPNGQSVGVKAPGGTIIRCTLDGKTVETVAGGIRNAYDMVFDSRNNLFFHDSDMETDMGTTWYRPTMIFNVAAGGDYGWRSGWAKFPQHFIDQVPAVVETGRGSPTGAILYQHINFPLRYQGAMFFADWAKGSIVSMRTENQGAGLVGEVKTFVTGKPLNVCDLAVDPFGALCFCTGGRGTEGGVYRITWKGDIPEAMKQFDSDIARVIRQPQPNSAWGRQQIASLRRKIGDDWNETITGVAAETRNPTDYRIRAMDLMVLYGPTPTPSFLQGIAKDSDPEIRSGAARLCGAKRNSSDVTSLVRNLLTDGNAMVRRVAGETALRLGIDAEIETLTPMLKSYDRIEALVARRLLERLPVEQWSSTVLSTDETRVFIQGAAAMMIAAPTLERSYQVLARVSTFMDGFINDADFIDMLRVAQLALVRGDVDPGKIPAFANRLGKEFPSGNSLINQELSRLLAYLRNGQLEGRLEEYLASQETPNLDKLHVAMLMQTIGRSLPSESKIAIIRTLEELKSSTTILADNAYVSRAIRDVTSTISPEQLPVILENGDQWTDAMLASLFLMPQRLDWETVNQLTKIDEAISEKEGESTDNLRTGIIAVLAQSGDEDSMKYLRQIWEVEPERRSEISLGLAQKPDGENWGYLVSSLGTINDQTGTEVLGKLVSVGRRPRDARHYRDVITMGYRLRQNGLTPTVRLLEHWSGAQRPNDGKSWKETLDDWKQWYETTFPTGDPISTGLDSNGDAMSTMEIMEQLDQLESISAQRGQLVFQSANCSKCHRSGGIGNAIGPELTNLANRFSRREIIEATVNPSAHIADRYRSSIVMLTDGRQIEGLAARDYDDSLVILLKNGDRVRYQADEIEGTKASEISPMPERSLDGLTWQQIGDLIEYMSGADRTARMN